MLERCNSWRKKLGINDSNTSFGSCCVFPNNCWTQNFIFSVYAISCGIIHRIPEGSKRAAATGTSQVSTHSPQNVSEPPNTGSSWQTCSELCWAGCRAAQRDPSEDRPKQNTVLTAANPHWNLSILERSHCRKERSHSETAAGLISKPVHHRTQGSATQRETCCSWGYQVTATLKTKVGLSAINCFLSPDVSPEGCKSWRRPQVATCSVATYSWAEWCRHLCHRPPWQSSRRGTAGATAPSLRPAALTSAMLAQGRVCWEIKGITHTSPARRTQLQAGEVGSDGGCIEFSIICFPLYVPGWVASSLNCSGSSFSKFVLFLRLTFLLLFFKLTKLFNYF